MSITASPIYSSPSSQDPSGVSGFAGAGSIWAHTDDGIWLTRNSGNTCWNIIGSGDQVGFGLYPLTGGSTSGAVSGMNGIITADGNTPFAVPPTITSKSSLMATMLDLYNLQQAISTLVVETVSNALASVVAPGIRSNMAFGYFAFAGTQSPVTATVPIISQGSGSNVAGFNLTYPDGSTVGTADCVAFATQAYTLMISGGTNVSANFMVQSPAGMAWTSYSSLATVPTGFTFMIIAIKKGA